jgi:hypothetical protein
MRNATVGVVLGVVCSLYACKEPLKSEEGTMAIGSAPARPATPNTAALPGLASVASPPAASAVAAPATPAVPREYSTEGLRAIPDNCAAPQVVLTAVPRSVFDAAGFNWRFARQVAVANHFSYPIVEMSGPGHVYFSTFEHKPTKGVALVAKCNDTKTCTQFAAAYRTVVPTSKPEVLCGSATTLGAELNGPQLLAFDSGEIVKAALPTESDVIGKCVRLAACQAERDKKLDGDPALACQKKPSAFKLDCAAKFPCSAVLSCMGD